MHYKNMANLLRMDILLCVYQGILWFILFNTHTSVLEAGRRS